MQELKLSVSVSIDLTDNAKSFLQILFANLLNQEQPTERPVVAKSVAAEPAEKPVAAEPAEKPVATEPVKKKAQKPKTDTDGHVTLEDIRTAVIDKLNDHREQIKNKLTELGVQNVTKLKEDDYAEFFEFLKSL